MPDALKAYLENRKEGSRRKKTQHSLKCAKENVHIDFYSAQALRCQRSQNTMDLTSNLEMLNFAAPYLNVYEGW